MKQLGSMDFDQLITLKAKVETMIADRVQKERKRLTASLERLNAFGSADKPATRRRRSSSPAKNRKLAAKYRNPENPKETWAGRGLKPRWLVAALKGGKKKLADFAVDRKH